MGVGSRRGRGGKTVQLPPLPLHLRQFRPGVVSRQEFGHKILVRQAVGEDIVPISHNFDLLVPPLLRLCTKTTTNRNLTNLRLFFPHLPHSQWSEIQGW